MTTEVYCPEHIKVELPYVAWHEWAERRHKAGDRQSQCPVCLRWFFPEEMGE